MTPNPFRRLLPPPVAPARPAPVLLRPGSKLRPYQEPSVPVLINALTRFGVALDASDPGSGKTFIACEVARKMGRKMVVIAPSGTHHQWREVAAYIGAEIADTLTYDKLRNGNTRWLKFVAGVTRNKENRVMKWCADPNTYLVIYDEGHACKGQDTLNAKTLICAKESKLTVLVCSATVATDPTEMRAIGFALGLHNLHNFYHWCRDHGCKPQEWYQNGQKRVGGLKFDANSTIMLGIHKQIFPARGVRLEIKDLIGFPPTQISADAYDLGPGTARAATALTTMKAEIARLRDRVANWKESAFTVIAEARMITEAMKIPLFQELAENALGEGMSVAIFLNFTENIHTLAKKLKTHCLIIGGQAEEDRQEMQRQFQANESRVVICNCMAGGVGISLHDVHHKFRRYALISPNYSAAGMRQVLGRVHRDGGTPSVQKIVFAKDTIEEAACEAVRYKLGNLDLLNNGDFSKGVF